VQKSPFRLRRSRLVPHSAFLQLNWIFDAFFVRSEIAMELAGSGIRGLALGPALDARSGEDMEDRQQLLMSVIIPGVETSRLPTVTCRQDNEESRWQMTAGRTRFDSSTPYCGRVKFHPPVSVAMRSEALSDSPDVFQTAEWFGSGGEAHRLTICTERVAELVTSRGWRGLEFRQVQEDGYSQPRSSVAGSGRAPNAE